jgi:protein-S-isoprenylcysteine O-methyltransferase Ste14
VIPADLLTENDVVVDRRTEGTTVMSDVAELDVRVPMGVMFALLGAVLAVFGLVSDKAIYGASLGININLWWGLVILAFGLLMLLLAWRGRGKTKRQPRQPQGVDPSVPPDQVPH